MGEGLGVRVPSSPVAATKDCMACCLSMPEEGTGLV
jgi:hypothetical protein